jgi:predicted acetylornithine/succinylornithine family transaminase
MAGDRDSVADSPARKSMNLKQIVEAESKYLTSNYKKYPLFVEKGRKCIVYDFAGKRYIDLLAGIAVNALGYNHPRIMNILRKQIRKSIHVCNLFYHPYQALLAQKLVEISGLDKAFFCNSGTEAVEAAFKLARGYAYKNQLGDGKHEILTLDNAFHGRTYGALSATASDKYRKPYEPLVPGFRFVRFNDVEDLKTNFNERVCAIIIEPLQGEGGIHACSDEFLKAARELCDEHRALLIFDEIQCGIGRTGRYFYYQKSDIRPDILTLAKPLGLGIPLGAVLTTDRVAPTFGPGDHGTTFGGGPLACRLGFEFIKVLEQDGLLAEIQEKGEYFRNKLSGLKKRYSFVADVRGEGLMLGMQLDFPCRNIVNRCLEEGFIINVTSDNVLRFLPPYIISKKEISKFIKALDRIFAEVDSARTGTLPAEPAPAGEH